jgi:hypothetical protein
MLRALLAHPQEASHKRHLEYCLSIMSVGCATIAVLTLYARNIPSAICVAPPEDEQVMLETCRGFWFSISWMKSASLWFHYTDIRVLWCTVSITLRSSSLLSNSWPSLTLRYLPLDFRGLVFDRIWWHFSLQQHYCVDWRYARDFESVGRNSQQEPQCYRRTCMLHGLNGPKFETRWAQNFSRPSRPT